jgi:hypothetical protein
MSNRFQMVTFRQILVRMRQGDRVIARSGLMRRKSLGALRHQAHCMAAPQQPLPDDRELAVLQRRRKQAVPIESSRCRPLLDHPL